jgi:hypothetical protein
MKSLGIGSTIWRFDINRRVYPPRKSGERYSSEGPIWRQHWKPEKIESETSRSWVTDYGTKLPKNGGWDKRTVCISEEEIGRRAYIHDHRHKIADRVQRIDDYAALVEIAALVGYEVIPLTVNPMEKDHG